MHFKIYFFIMSITHGQRNRASHIISGLSPSLTIISMRSSRQASTSLQQICTHTDIKTPHTSAVSLLSVPQTTTEIPHKGSRKHALSGPRSPADSRPAPAYSITPVLATCQLTCMKAVQRSQVTSLRDLVMLPASTQHGTAASVVVASALAREAAATSNTSSMVYNVMDHANNNGEKCCFVGNVLYH